MSLTVLAHDRCPEPLETAKRLAVTPIKLLSVTTAQRLAVTTAGRLAVTTAQRLAATNRQDRRLAMPRLAEGLRYEIDESISPPSSPSSL